MQTTMRSPFSGALIHQLERLFQHGTAIGLTEGQLLERFVGCNDEAAFEALIARHGPMVLGVCRRFLRDPNDVDDAFQATFLVLVRRAGTLRRRDLLGNWLYGVAHRVAMRSRAVAARRMARAPHGQDVVERLDAGCGRRNGDASSAGDPEPGSWLHEEVRQLPEKYRTLVLLCYFEGLSHEEAAARLDCPIGTIKGRLARARDLLRRRLVRRGVTLSASAIAAHLAGADLRAAVPESLKSATLEAARAIAGAAGSSIVASSSVSLPVATLADGVSQAMFMTKLKAITITLLLIGAVTTGAIVSAARVTPQGNSFSESPSRSALREAIAEDARLRQDAARKNNGPFGDADSSGAGRKSESSASSAPGGAGGQAPAQAGGAGAMSRPVQSTNIGGEIGGGALDDGSAEEFQDRLTITHLAAALAACDENPKNEALLKGLDEPLAMSFAKPTPLVDVLKYIKSSTAKSGRNPLPIYVDPKGLEDADVKPESKVVIDLEGVPLKTTLRLVLKQVGLAYCVRDGVVIISSVGGVRQELAEAARELIGGGNEQISRPMLNQMGIIPRGRSGVPAKKNDGGLQ
jgi:RNA polymerase sigma factor (sigma-70 family)